MKMEHVKYAYEETFGNKITILSDSVSYQLIVD